MAAARGAPGAAERAATVMDRLKGLYFDKIKVSKTASLRSRVRERRAIPVSAEMPQRN